jgi:hypothetical protein
MTWFVERASDSLDVRIVIVWIVGALIVLRGNRAGGGGVGRKGTTDRPKGDRPSSSRG